ncbi:MAG: sensor histidine kinase [Microbacterium gubbeenense]|uniref:sensor histidine kinase n=1 Tax=Microbacterium gubbeenense TaxID=159896 RepID=UPI003F957E47
MTAADPRIEYATGARLRPWSRVWRYLLVVVSGFLAWLLSYGLFATEVAEGAPDSTVVFVMALFDPIVCVIAICLLPLRRRAPMTIALVTAALSALSTSTASGPAQLAAASNATHRRWLPIVLNGVTYILALAAFELLVPIGTFDSPWVGVIGTAVAFLVPAGFGLYIGARRALIASLHERAVEAERERELQVSAAEAGERTRIAREMHDVLAHRISLVAMHAGALTYREDLTRDQTRETAQLVQDNARRALGELSQVLGVLRAAGNGVEPPQPTLADLPALIEDAAQAGARIDVENDAAGDPPDLVSRTAYRTVQESLTNARKHAPGAPIRVRVDGRAGGLLVIEVTNGSALAAPSEDVAGSGLGLMGLAERIDLVGGTLEFGPDGKSGFAVRAWLPWEESDD